MEKIKRHREKYKNPNAEELWDIQYRGLIGHSLINSHSLDDIEDPMMSK